MGVQWHSWWVVKTLSIDSWQRTGSVVPLTARAIHVGKNLWKNLLCFADYEVTTVSCLSSRNDSKVTLQHHVMSLSCAPKQSLMPLQRVKCKLV